MDDRYNLLMKAHVRNISVYNTKFISRNLNPKEGHRYMPYIVVIIDEFGDLIMTAGKKIETPIVRIAKKGQAVGIHIIIATQRLSKYIISETIKANFPARIALSVSSTVDSRTILDSPEANKLVGRGDLLYSQDNEMTRVQCALIETDEIKSIVKNIGDQTSFKTAYKLPCVLSHIDAIKTLSLDYETIRLNELSIVHLVSFKSDLEEISGAEKEISEVVDNKKIWSSRSWNYFQSQ